ncbi:SDR family oxidoreductase [Novosphingobium sp. JCM 18896]|uniref:SDR family oxidoreductase n=1 Tax=Novosphingobium sp. JCM 18896 TaxID=2989731 RepID=UPI0022236A66|nr:SDR family oxidoreductase [Novosphingobium sp. JCM 18896]MCW1427613.1 SDR family oxidoreductase [Novosphingobium sp. JCM 18896]
MQKDLAGKTALVTGGGRGIGRAMAERLAAAGALVAVNYAGNHQAAADTVAAIEAAGGQAFTVQARIGEPGENEKLIAALDKEFTARTGSKEIDILINNIGGGDYATILDSTEALYDQTFNNNVRGPFLLTRALYHHLRDHGRVVNISSTGSRLTDPGIIVYSMAKAAVEAFTRVLAQDLGHRGITVNAVSPGFTAGETNLHVTEDPELAKGVIDFTALKRFGQPKEIADIVYALASPLGRWITAQTIDASGGFKL